jgi:hypothetical protein
MILHTKQTGWSINDFSAHGQVMKAAGGGNIINISSIHGVVTLP